MKRDYLKLAYKYAARKFPFGKIRTIFLDHYEEYRKKYSIRSVEDENIIKMLSCRTPLRGKHIYKCPNCGKEKEVPHSCKSRFCSVCGYVANLDWMRKRFGFILDCHYHHIVVTVSAYFRWIIKQDRTRTLNLFARVAAEVIQEYSNQQGYEVGMICFFHSFGDTLQFHPHFHILVTAGGLKPDGTWYYSNADFPGQVLMRRFKAKFVSGIKKLFREGIVKTKGNLSRVLYQVSHQHDKYWQFFTERITREGPQTMMYCARYCKKMIISEQRIIDYDGKTVTFWNSKKTKIIVMGWEQFMCCVIQHIPDKHFRLIRYYGFYTNKSWKKYRQAKKYWNPLAASMDRLDWQTRQMLRNANNPEHGEKPLNPLVCPECGTKMLLHKITYPEPAYKITFENIRLVLGLAVSQYLEIDSS